MTLIKKTIQAFLSTVLLFSAAAVFSAPNPHLKTVPAGEAKDWAFLDNGQIRIGMKKISGAGVAWLSHSGSGQNVLNHWDHGRLIQQSSYGAKDGSLWNGKPWRWNPVQGGDWKGNAAKVLELNVEKNMIYAKTLPRHWAAGADLTETKQGDEEKPARMVPLLDDTRFEQGFTVWSPVPGSHVKQGVIQPGNTQLEPLWGLAQWHSRFTLAEAQREQLPSSAVRFADDAKAVTFFPPESDVDISFALNGNIEYDGRAPQRGDPWPHLLAERKLLAHPAISELESVQLAIRYRLIKADVHRPDGFDPRRHTAQFVFYITVQNRNRQSPGFGDYYWFGIPLYDARDRLPRAHKAVDKGSDRKPATGKFIFNPGGKCYTTNSAHDGDWVAIDKDLLPLIREGLEAAWDKGFLQDSHDPADYCLMAMNTGWEVTGPLDVEMQLAGLRLEAVQKGN